MTSSKTANGSLPGADPYPYPLLSPSPSLTPLLRPNSSCGQGRGGSWRELEEPLTTTTLTMTQVEMAMLCAVLVVVFLTSVTANALVCVVFSKRRRSLSLSNRFLANLTLCNCLFTVLVMPVAFSSLVSRRWLLGPALCQVTGLTLNLLVTASIFTLVVISLDRYCAVVTPLHYTLRMTRRRCGTFIAGIWVSAAVVSFPPLVGWNSFKFHVNKMICTVAWDSADAGDRYYTLFLVTVSFVLPLLAMLWTYSCIFRAARDNSERTRRSSIVPTLQPECDTCQCTPVNKRRRSSAVPILRRLSQTSCRSGSLLQRREEWTTAVTSFLILFSFMLCWLPYFVVICLRSLAPSLSLHPVLSTISTVAAMFACACNPIVYVLRNKATRHELHVILSRSRLGSFRNEVLQSSWRRGGGGGESVKGSSVGGGGGEGGTKGEAGREKGSVFWQEDAQTHGECHSIQEEEEEAECHSVQDLPITPPPADADADAEEWGDGEAEDATVPLKGGATLDSIRTSPFLQQC